MPTALTFATVLSSSLLAMAAAAEGGAQTSPWFGIRVVDQATGRGVPLVELTPNRGQTTVTDSNGWAAFCEPGWEDQVVWFNVRSHGYHAAKDGFGQVGKAVTVRAGTRTTIAIERDNIAERLYRLTGDGIYRDSVLLGEPVPLRKPLLNARVMGQDTVSVAPYRGRLFWLWGDTERLEYGLGNFKTTSGWSDLPASGGLDPARGVDLEYITADNGFTREMCRFPGTKGNLVWMGGLIALPDAKGQERLVGHYAVLEGLGKATEHGIAVYNDETRSFDKAKAASDWRSIGGNPSLVREGGTTWTVFNGTTRIPASYEAALDPARWEAFTCIADGAEFAGAKTTLARTADGAPAWRWTALAPPLNGEQEAELLKAGALEPGQARFQLIDAATGDRVVMHNGSRYWNAYLKAWVIIASQRFGRSFLGEVWLATAPSAQGPFSKAVRIITHDKYTFYNPTQHPYFDQDGGRTIYLEGTYVTTFSGNENPTPRYDYNQIMYRVDLADPRLAPATH